MTMIVQNAFTSATTTIAQGPLAATTDTVTVTARGDELATVKFLVVGTAGTASCIAEVSIDGGTNWFASAYAKRYTSVSSNPAVGAINGALGSGDGWEIPLPGNATHFRVRCAVAGTPTTVSVFPGANYVPGVPVVATLYDVTEGSIGAGVAVQNFDISGWSYALMIAVNPTTQVWVVRPLDDTGVLVGNNFSFAAGAGGTLVFSRSAGSSNSATFGTSANTTNASPYFPKRFATTLPAGGTVSTGRFRIELAR